ncbi:MAG: ester cyclase [Actinomycetota bacterium]|nr:ester cyclase [Actinomycetota bacterium]
MTPEELKAKARRFIDEVFNKRNLKHAEESLSKDFTEHSPFTPELGSGRDAAIEGFRLVIDSSDDLRAEILDLVSDGHRIAIRARYSGTDTGGYMPGVAPTGKRFEIEGIDVATVDDDGNYSEHYGIPDLMTAMQQIGLAPAGPPPSA